MADESTDAAGRLLNHAELVYAPGDRELTQRVLEALGCRVVDTGGRYLVAFVRPELSDFYDNCLYASEMTEEQQSLDDVLARGLASSGELGDLHRRYVARFEVEPQRTTHVGFRLGSEAELAATLEDVEKLGTETGGRIRVASVIRPGDAGCLDPGLVQAFVRTDVCALGLVCLGQHFELQVRVPREDA